MLRFRDHHNILVSFVFVDLLMVQWQTCVIVVVRLLNEICQQFYINWNGKCLRFACLIFKWSNLRITIIWRVSVNSFFSYYNWRCRHCCCRLLLLSILLLLPLPICCFSTFKFGLLLLLPYHSVKIVARFDDQVGVFIWAHPHSHSHTVQNDYFTNKITSIKWFM